VPFVILDIETIPKPNFYDKVEFEITKKYKQELSEQEMILKILNLSFDLPLHFLGRCSVYVFIFYIIAIFKS